MNISECIGSPHHLDLHQHLASSALLSHARDEANIRQRSREFGLELSDDQVDNDLRTMHATSAYGNSTTQIFVKTQGKSKPLKVLPTALVADAKEESVGPVAAHNYTMQFEGRVLEEMRSLESYGVRDGSTVHLVLRGVGGTPVGGFATCHVGEDSTIHFVERGVGGAPGGSGGSSSQPKKPPPPPTAAVGPVPPEHKGWFAALPSETQAAIRDGHIPVILVMGETGTGKTTSINRMSTAISQERAAVMQEGDGAVAGTYATEARVLPWLGEARHPVVFIDMPGLNDPDDKDSTIIRDGCKFLSSAPIPGVHQIVLVVDGQNPRLSKPLREIIRVLRDVFDSDGAQGFVEHLSVMFTKIPFAEWSDEEPADFGRALDAKRQALADSWASLATGLGQKNVLDLTQPEADALKKRFLFVNNTLRPKLLSRLQRDFGLQPHLGLDDVYLRAHRFLKKPFALSAMRPEVMRPEQAALKKAEADAKAATEAARAAEAKAKAEAEEKAALEKAVGKMMKMLAKMEAAARAVHARGPFDDDALEEELKVVIGDAARHLDSLSQGLNSGVLSGLRARISMFYDEQVRINVEASQRLNQQLADRILAECAADVLRVAEECARQGADTHEIYSRYYNSVSEYDNYSGSSYIGRFVRGRRGVEQSTYTPYEQLQAGVARQMSRLRDKIFGAAWVARQVRESKLVETTRHCPHCRIVWTREAGCKAVRCGFLNFDGSGDGETVPVPARGRNGIRHGCGRRFDYEVAPSVSAEEERQFWEKTPQTVEAERRRDAKAADDAKRRVEAVALRQAAAASREGSSFERVMSSISDAAASVERLWVRR